VRERLVEEAVLAQLRRTLSSASRRLVRLKVDALVTDGTAATKVT